MSAKHKYTNVCVFTHRTCGEVENFIKLFKKKYNSEFIKYSFRV